MLSDLEAAAQHLATATAPEHVFGTLDGSLDEKLRALTLQYRRVVQTVHPDKFNAEPLPIRDRAKEVFVKLSKWREDAEAKIRAGSYGDGKPHEPPPPPAPKMPPQVIKAGKRTYIVTELLATGDLADVYACSYTESGKEQHVVFKVAQAAADNDLLENENKVLSAMYAKDQPEEKFYRYLPKPLDSFMLRGSGSPRRVNVLQRAEGYVTLAEILKAYPKGLDFRDVVWMFKRMLAGIGYAHIHKHVVHGGIVPTNVMVHPTGHGAKILDWCYAVPEWEKGTGRVRALSKPYRDFYAPEILKKLPPSPQTDLYMIAKCAVALLGGDVVTNQVPATVPKPIQAFLGSCLLPAQHRRPDDAWKLHEDFDELLQRLVGKPKYRPLVMPAV